MGIVQRFPRRWKGLKPAFGFSRLSTGRHFHTVSLPWVAVQEARPFHFRCTLHVRHSQFQDRRYAVGADNRGTQEHVTFACSDGGPVRRDQQPVNSSTIVGKLSNHTCRSPWLRQFARSCSGISIDSVERSHVPGAIVNRHECGECHSFCRLGRMTHRSENASAPVTHSVNWSPWTAIL